MSCRDRCVLCAYIQAQSWIQCSAFNVADTLFQLLSWFQRPQKPSDLDAIPPIPMSFFSSVAFACFGYGRGRYKTVCLLHISNQNACSFTTKLLFILFMFFVYPYLYIYIYTYIWQYGLAVLHRYLLGSFVRSWIRILRPMELSGGGAKKELPTWTGRVNRVFFVEALKVQEVSEKLKRWRKTWRKRLILMLIQIGPRSSRTGWDV